jgi:tagatose-6-phosphate ketose/aldose isomerase
MNARSGETPTEAVGPTSVPGLADLLARPLADQRTLGYHHTIREIDQQPDTWVETAQSVVGQVPALLARFIAAGLVGPAPTGSIVLTGSGSSHYVGEAVARHLQRALRVPVAAVSSGEILTHLDAWVVSAHGLVVSFARSGDSPESSATLDELLAARPGWHHLIITCNGAGRLTTEHSGRPEVFAVVLDSRTCDRSLVMTSSFTNMAVAALGLSWLDDPGGYVERVDRLAEVGRNVLSRSGVLAAAAGTRLTSAIFLGSGSGWGAARESALKMLEMTGGTVLAMPETFLGLRHGPMSAVHDDTLVVGFLSSEPVTRAYELDVLLELKGKSLGRRLIVGEDVPEAVVADGDTVLECPGLARLGDDFSAVTDVVVGQLLGLFRCLSLGLHPDSPSSDNVINRVVAEFTIHRRHS